MNKKQDKLAQFGKYLMVAGFITSELKRKIRADALQELQIKLDNVDRVMANVLKMEFKVKK